MVGRSITDIDGNAYGQVSIGGQVWLRENLKVTRFRDGTPIARVADDVAWTTLTTAAYCDYVNDMKISRVYGRLYNWWAVRSEHQLAPAGWHVASKKEWQALIAHLGGVGVAAGELKETGTRHWKAPNVGATNSSNFLALGAGARSGNPMADQGGTFFPVHETASWWSSTERDVHHGWGPGLFHLSVQIFENDFTKRHGLSVRCVRD